MYHGELNGELFGDSLDEQNIMRLATGASLFNSTKELNKYD